MLAICVNLGIVFGYMIASWLEYRASLAVPIVITCVFLLAIAFLPESPDYLSHKNKVEEAKKSYQFYGNFRSDSEEVQENGQVVTHGSENGRLTWADLKDRAVGKGVFISFLLILFMDSAGIIVVIGFLTELFHWAKIEMDVYLATIAVGVIQVLGAVISTLLVDRLGRRWLLMGSCTGTAFCFYALGWYFFILEKGEYQNLVENLQWLPLVAVCGSVLIASTGVVTLPFLIIAELLPVKVRGTITSVSLTLSWVFAFFVCQYYHTMIEYFTVAGTIWTFVTSCLIELFFVFFFLPETKNLSIEEIQKKLRK